MNESFRLISLIAALAALGLVGCGEDAVMPGVDSGTFDAAGTDAGEPDSGSRSEDAGTDASPDYDRDGVPDAVDCEPMNAVFGSTSERSCSTLCGDGMETCTDGVWGACDAPTECLCSTEGATRIHPCGMCGEQGEACRGGVWTATSVCTGEGECSAGDVEDRSMPDYCRLEQRLCGSECTWGSWVVVMTGECRRGERRCTWGPPPRNYRCTDECRMELDPDCKVRVP